ncbi:MAG: GatB/YqeY domain-containing protein [Acidobacteria bacterium]|nr:MAG: GatB/YqeY domain-containing protein [Acidobacteriota bacterium]
MALSEQIQQDLVAALKAHDELRLSTLRMMKSALQYRKVETGHDLDDAEVHKVLGTMIKQREDSAEQFTAGARPELAAKEKAEIVIIEGYLPRALSPEEIEATVRAAIAETGAASPKDLGKAMKAAMARFQANQQRADGKLVHAAITRLLSGQNG